MPNIIEHVERHIEPERYYANLFDHELRWNGDEARIRCVFHEDRTPSLFLNKGGKYFCHGCGAKGGGIVSFHKDHNALDSHVEAARQLYNDFIHPLVNDSLVRRWATALASSRMPLHYAGNVRMVSAEVIERYELGWNGQRIMFPIRNEFGDCCNVKMYDPGHKQHGAPKMLNYTERGEDRSFGSPAMLWPMQLLMLLPFDIPVIIVEGEWDAAALLSLGIPAITSTAGSKGWPKQLNEYFRGREVVVIYDNDEEGEEGGLKVARHLRSYARSVKRVKVPKLKYTQRGVASTVKDVTDWMRADERMRKREAWETKIERAEVIVDNPEDYVARDKTIHVSLDRASEAQYHGARIVVDAIITGKGRAPFTLPLKYRALCNKSCEDCPLARLKRDHMDKELDPKDVELLHFLGNTTEARDAILLRKSGLAFGKGCGGRIEPLSHFNVERLLLIPSLDAADGQYVIRECFYSGHGLHPNQGYTFNGTTATIPRTQETTHLFWEAKPAKDAIESFTMTPELRDKLKVFRPRRLNVMAHLVGIAFWQSEHLTQIRERPDLHIAIDLVFHSVPRFVFNGEVVERGMLDVLVLGDTRTGKGRVATGLNRHYGVGEWASGENCSFAGLVGGAQQLATGWFVKWGIIPLNNNRLVVIDEASSLQPEEIADMSRVRSEGIAEITKIVKEQTRANTRLVWLSNTRTGRSIMSYNSGIEAIRELIGANEDIARYDFAMTVATEEVDAEVINIEAAKPTTSAELYPRDLCRALILWVWSRSQDQVEFQPDATKLILAKSIEFGNKYSSEIPLVQRENVRIKLAKIAAAVAARCFSSDDTGERIVVTVDHVRFAAQFLVDLYDKRSMGYDKFSSRRKRIDTLGDTSELEAAINQAADPGKLMLGLLDMQHIDVDQVADYVDDAMTAKSIISRLVQQHALVYGKGSYRKTPPFVEWLRTRIKGKV